MEEVHSNSRAELATFKEMVVSIFDFLLCLCVFFRREQLGSKLDSDLSRHGRQSRQHERRIRSELPSPWILQHHLDSIRQKVRSKDRLYLESFDSSRWQRLGWLL